MFDEDSASEVSLEDGAEGQGTVQEQLEHASVAQSGPTTTEGQPAAVPAHQSLLRRFSKEHAVSEDIQKRFMIAVENDEKAAKKRVQEMLVSLHQTSVQQIFHFQTLLATTSRAISSDKPVC